MIPPHCSNRALKKLSTISVHKFALSLMVGSAILSLVIIFSYEERKSFLEYVPDVDSGNTTTKEFSISDERTKNVSQFRNKTYKLERVKEAIDDSVIRFHPNLPKELLIPSFDLPSLAPDLTSIRWTGTLYQESWKNSPKFLLYSAFLDSRVQHKLDVRILALYDGGILQDLSKLFCVFWFEGDRTPVKTSVTTAYLIDDDYSPYRSDNSYILSPYMMTCNANSLKGYQQKPFAVSLFSLDSKQLPTNLLKISGSWDGKTGSQSSFRDIRVGICGKALFYYNTDFSLRLIEWIEIMKQLGVSNIVLYKARCHENVEKVLKYYESRGFVKIISFFYPPPYVSEPAFVRLWTKTKKKEYRGAQKIYLNDCLLRFKDDFDFVGVFDPDEIPILKKHRTIPQFLRGIQRKYENRKEIASIQLMWKHFYRNLEPGMSAANVTSDLYILKHNMRSELRGRDEDVIETTGKCFYDPRNVLAVAIHVPLQIYSESDFPQRMKVISRTIAYTGHFGDKICNEECRQRFVFEEETALMPLQEVVAGGVRAVKKAIGLE